ncbi:hypothetical protein RFI_05151 [Reticulomyxa filosa]|uniref:Kelch motif family protein n=1 Tax=Reticulomyxa filosa TaxID=46433 RepID=X6P165_RETFI|nr:hypothetical protein RFI_05151 [Reticulomyxa filosa]|eukprot:ETO31966.1 hypothetical protein RFI_05151 [Reticulomyxa filosa]
MGNQTTTQKQSQLNITSTSFQSLKDLPTPLFYSQCVTHKHELLICGGYEQRAFGHCVVKLVDNNSKDSNQITLLSFGGSPFTKKYTLAMKYVSVWSNISKKSNKLNNYNQWIPFTDNDNHSIIIGREYDDYRGGVVFDLNTFQFIKHDTLPTNNIIFYHCFVSNSENGQGQQMMTKNKQNCQILLFCFKTGLSIEYDEDNNIFKFHQLQVCDDIAPLFRYAYVCINDAILFFGGCNNIFDENFIVSKAVYMYSIREYKWITFENTLPSSLTDFVAILSEDSTYVHIIGGHEKEILSIHMKTKVSGWRDTSNLIKLGWIDDFNKIIIKYIKMQ